MGSRKTVEQNSVEEIIRRAVEAGRQSAERSAKDAFKATERRLYGLPTLELKYRDDLEKLAELKARRDQLVAREKTAKAQAQVTDALNSINILDPTSELGRFEDRVRRQEAMAQGKAELAASSLDAQFAELETDSSQLEIEARLAALKNKQ